MRGGIVAAVAALAAGALLVALPACTSSSSDPATGDASSRRSFRRDVMPILAQSCASQSCHGDPRNALGLDLVVSDPDAVYAELQHESVTAKGAKLVVPGDPAKSFLYAKIVGDQGDYTDMCAMPGCGETMPPGSKIPSIQRDTIQQWILEGATND
jgi:hypothetical protein